MAVNDTWFTLFSRSPDWVEDACQLCEKNPMFRNLGTKSVRRLVSQMHRRSYQAGEPVFSMGNAGVGAVLILSGEVTISANNVQLGVMQRGDMFGEVALVADLPRTAQAVATRDCELLFFMRSDLQEWMARMPKDASRLLQNLAQMLAQRLMERNQILAKQDDS